MLHVCVCVHLYQDRQLFLCDVNTWSAAYGIFRTEELALRPIPNFTNIIHSSTLHRANMKYSLALVPTSIKRGSIYHKFKISNDSTVLRSIKIFDITK